ncbi:flavodoxin family protein [Desulfosporosinus sp. FKB]|uniref:flavodoxin family protein n=1 Tax=Desulfosporosinus sp. FKB TaxID=1969835 RepID=UPI0032B7B5FC
MVSLLIAAINGSPNRDGNTALLLREALSAAQKLGAETQLINVAEVLNDLAQPFCDSCTYPCNASCAKGNKLGEALAILRRTDGLIIGSPVYYGTISGQLAAFWDKTNTLWQSKALLNVVGGAVTVAMARFGGQETTLKAIHDLMLVQGMIIVGDGHRDFDCGHQGVCAQQPSREDVNAIERAHIMVRRIAEVAGATQSLRYRS